LVGSNKEEDRPLRIPINPLSKANHIKCFWSGRDCGPVRARRRSSSGAREPPVTLMNFRNRRKEDLEDCADAALPQSGCSSKITTESEIFWPKCWTETLPLHGGRNERAGFKMFLGRAMTTS